MLTFFLYILLFIIITVLIFFTGSKLILYADAVSEKTKISQLWIGMIAISIVTSLPELVSNLSAVLIVREPDLALGNIIGSNNFNLIIFFAIELFYVGGSVFDVIKKKYMKAVNISIVMIFLILIQLLIKDKVGPGQFLGINFYPDLSVAFISGISVLILLTYYIGVKFYMKDLDLEEDPIPVEEKYLHMSNKQVIWNFFFYSFLIVILGISMSLLADKISTFKLELGNTNLVLGHTFVGSLFLAFATSLPELVVSIQAIRKVNSVNMAIGNIFGSNMFNFMIISISDFFYFKGPIFHNVASSHLISAGTFILFISIISFGILKKKKHRLKISIESILIFVFYIIYLFILFKFRIFDTL